MKIRVGNGYDVHRLEEGRKLILCGVEVPHDKGLLGHSDADVATHALIDALLGAAGLGDIGSHFPDTDPAYKGIYSIQLLEHTAALLKKRGLRHRKCGPDHRGPKAQIAALFSGHAGKTGSGSGNRTGAGKHQGQNRRETGLYRPDGRDESLRRSLASGPVRRGAVWALILAM